MLFNLRPVRDIDRMKREIARLVNRQKPGTWDDLSPFRSEIGDLLSCLSEFSPSWVKAPLVYRIARVNTSSGRRTYGDNVELPNTRHDIDLVLKMLNHRRKEKGLAEVKMPLFLQPDEMMLARRDGRIDFQADGILSQLAVVLQKGAIIVVGFVFGANYVLLEN